MTALELQIIQGHVTLGQIKGLGKERILNELRKVLPKLLKKELKEEVDKLYVFKSDHEATVKRFLVERTNTTDTPTSTQKGLFAAYKDFCKELNVDACSAQKFSIQLTKCGVKKTRRADTSYYHLSLKETT